MKFLNPRILVGNDETVGIYLVHCHLEGEELTLESVRVPTLISSSGRDIVPDLDRIRDPLIELKRVGQKISGKSA